VACNSDSRGIDQGGVFRRKDAIKGKAKIQSARLRLGFVCG
jgi:hypothetical protein